MAKIVTSNAVRSLFLNLAKKLEVKSRSSMSFVRVSSTNQMPDTFQSDSKQTAQFNKPAFSFVNEKMPFASLNNESASSSGAHLFSAREKDKTQPLNLKERSAPKKVSEIIRKYQELLKDSSGTNKKEAQKKTTVAFRERSSSLPVIKSDYSNTVENKEKAQGVQKIETIGHLFPSDKLMFSDAFQKTADKYGVVIGLRYPNELGQIHLAQGNPTKNFHVKAKSSSTGPTAGFVAENPKFSKVGAEKWKTQEGYIKDALSKGAQLVDLTLNEVQIKSAVDNGCMTPIGENQFSANYHGETLKFTIAPPDNIVMEENGEPVKVLTNPPESDGSESILKPITPDYDLFCILPKNNQDINSRPLEVGNNRLQRRKSNDEDNIKKSQDYIKSGGVEAFNKAIKTFTEPRAGHGTLDADKGNLHFFAHVIINDINNNVKTEGYTGGKLVWHGEENANPYSAGFDVSDKPVFFIPGQAPQQIESKSELRTFYNTLKFNGFSPESSPKFGV